MGKVKVLVIDDSAVVRQTMVSILERSGDMEVIGAARDPVVALEMIKRTRPDVITLDLEMPRMNGIEFLSRIMETDPIPVVVCSGAASGNGEEAFRAVEIGAVEVIAKPKLGVKRFLEESAVQIGDAIRAACAAGAGRPRVAAAIPPKRSADAVISRGRGDAAPADGRIIVAGASTGGVEALQEFLQAMPEDSPPIAIVQHMPEGFTRAFAERLDKICRIRVKEAEHGDPLPRGLALIAPGNKHTLVKRLGSGFAVDVVEGPLVNRHRPSVDVLFRSAARYAGASAIGIIMTGMGDDGAAGLAELREAGGSTLAQDEASCVVYGMPREAVERGAAESVLPLEELASAALGLARRRGRGER
jgi:two-component system, chemotaxis family, protein-glutamate methylesterase/glutaminase